MTSKIEAATKYFDYASHYLHCSKEINEAYLHKKRSQFSYNVEIEYEVVAISGHIITLFTASVALPRTILRLLSL